MNFKLSNSDNILDRSLVSNLAQAAPKGRGAEVMEINVDGEDTDARRFYEAHGFTHTEPGATEPMFFYYREL